MSGGAAGGPVFVFSTHRSGGTLLARVLNCHPELVIWGEHGGFINKLAEIDAAVERYPPLTSPLASRGLDSFVQGAKSDPASFNPWVTPFARDGFRQWCRAFIETTFSRGLRPGQRWGFKEIRYHTVATAAFLAALFPDARFVILRRALYPLAVSNLLAPWSVDRLRWSGALATASGVTAAIADCAYALTAIDHGLRAIVTVLPDRCHVVAHDSITPEAQQVFAELFMFLGLKGSMDLLHAIRAVVRGRVGATNFAASEGHLSLAAVQRELPAALAAAQADIAAHGPDPARLKRLAAQGRFSFVVGDHHMCGTQDSMMF
jgi:hypothetical protein